MTSCTRDFTFPTVEKSSSTCDFVFRRQHCFTFGIDRFRDHHICKTPLVDRFCCSKTVRFWSPTALNDSNNKPLRLEGGLRESCHMCDCPNPAGQFLEKIFWIAYSQISLVRSEKCMKKLARPVGREKILRFCIPSLTENNKV